MQLLSESKNELFALLRCSVVPLFSPFPFILQAVVTPARLVTTTAKAIQTHSSNQGVCEEGSLILATLSRSDAYRSSILENGGVDALSAAMMSMATNESVLANSLKTYCEIAQV